MQIRKDLVVGTFYGGCLFVPEMLALSGKTACITGVVEDGRCYRVHSSARYWTDKMFEGGAGVDKRIVIDSDGSKVVALDLETGKEGVARCHSDDKFDFYIGAKIALERLEEAEKPHGWLKKGTKYYVPDIIVKNLYSSYIYDADSADERYKGRGVVFQTKDEAIECAKKMLEVVKKEG